MTGERSSTVGSAPASRVGRDEVAEIGERIAERRELPVEQRQDARLGALEHDVAEAVVAVHDAGPARARQLVAKPVGELCDERQLARGVVLPERREAAHLALEVAVGATEVAQAGALDVDGVQLGERVDEIVARPPARAGVASDAGSPSVTTSPCSSSMT